MLTINVVGTPSIRRINMRSARSFACGLLILAGSAALWSCSTPAGQPAASGPAADPTSATPARAAVPLPTMADTTPIDQPGLHNLVAYHPGFVSGSQPEAGAGGSDAGLDTLAAMGVKTIISVDGAEPEVEKARARGMRYIHLPISYAGITPERSLELTRAVRDAMKEGPVYIHCHHGKHRSAGAAAVVAAQLGWATPEQGVERMKISGTAANYTGLYACAQQARPLDAATIDAVPADFPSVSKPSGFVQGMVDVDLAFEHLKAIEKAGWRTPASSPDLVPAAEAGRLADLYRFLRDTNYTRSMPAEMSTMLSESERRAKALEDMLAAIPAPPAPPTAPDTAKLSAQFKLVIASCKDCHAQYRDRSSASR